MLPVPVDLQALMSRLGAEERDLVRRLAEVEDQVRRFEDFDRPGYEAWLRLEFGPQLTDIDELIERIRERQAVARRVTELVDRGMRPREALYTVTVRSPETSMHEEKAKAGGWDADEIEARRRARRDAKREARREAKRETKREKRREQAQERVTAGASATGNVPGGGPQEVGRRRVVSLYRTLARWLHPDSADRIGSIPPERMHSLWLEVQEAYQAANLERMTAIAAWLETEAQDRMVGAPARHLTLSERFERIRSLRKSQANAETRLGRLRAHSGWKFAEIRGAQRRKLHQRARQEIDAELGRLQRIMDALDDFFDSIGSPKRPKGR